MRKTDSDNHYRKIRISAYIWYFVFTAAQSLLDLGSTVCFCEHSQHFRYLICITLIFAVP